MSALVVKTAKLNFSISYDGITIYFNFKTPDMFGNLNACYETFRLNQNLGVCTDRFKHSKDFDRYIRHADDDHLLYHQDQFRIEDDHSHIKLKTPITREKLIIMLDEFEKNQLITSSDKNDIIKKYDERNNESLINMRSGLSGTKDVIIDTREIINFIKECVDNDIIGFLYKNLLDKRFDYLRASPKFSMNEVYQGTNAEGRLIETTKQWAAIQKAVSLQLAKNFKDECGKFSDKVASERTAQLNSAYTFFALKRKVPFCSEKFTSSFFKAYSSKEDIRIEEKYKNFFKKY